MLARMRVVGMRINPCLGPTGSYVPSCDGELRLTAQFFRYSRDTSLTQPDGSVGVHLIYRVPAEKFRQLAEDLLTLRHEGDLTLRKGFMLQANRSLEHPMMHEQGLTGDHASGLKKVILKYAGAKNLGRVAISVQDIDTGRGGNGYYSNNPTRTRWVFAAYAHVNGKLKATSIPAHGQGQTQQSVTTVTNGFTARRALFEPAIPEGDSFTPLVHFRGTSPSDATVFREARNAAVVLQNPLERTVEDTDCLSCHMAKDAETIADRLRRTATVAPYSSPTYRVEEHSDNGIGPFRMFGYDSNRQAIVSARVTNETAEVLNFINSEIL